MAKGGSGDGKANSTNDTKAANNDKHAPPAAPPVTQYQFAQKPAEISGWEGFKKFLWNGETKEFLGRTGCSWFKIGVFYLIYYTLLTLFFIAMLVIFYQTLDDNEPKWQNANGIIGENPGLGFRPMPEDARIDSTLIWYTHGKYHEGYKGWVERLDKHLKNYTALLENAKPDPSVVECGFERGGAGEGQICQVNVSGLYKEPCNIKNKYGYENGTPCILLKLNRIYGWLPKPYENSSALPADAPAALREYVESKNSDPMMGKMVWMSCEGENPADVENIGDIEYFPQPGIPSYYFPFKNQKGYLSPVIFAHLKNPKQGVLIAVTCKAWANNIHHNTMERMGSVHFELMID